VLLHKDDDFSFGVTIRKIPDSFLHLTYWVTSIDNWCDLAGLAFTPDGQRLIIASATGAIELWSR